MTRIIQSVVFFVITALTVPLAAVAELATTPGDNRIAIFQPCEWVWGNTHSQLDAIADGIGYTMDIVYRQTSAPSTPFDMDDLTIGEYTDALACGWTQQYGPGILADAGHGSSSGFGVMYYARTDNGRVERYNDLVMLQTVFTSLDTVETTEGYCITAGADFHSTYYYPAPNNSGEVYLGGCSTLDWANSAFNGKARCWMGYSSAYIPTVYYVNEDAENFWTKRSGCCGVTLTTAGNASDTEPSGILGLGGNGASVLKPFVGRYRPPTTSVISGNTSGSVTFNCKMGPNPFCVRGTGSFSVDTQQFINDSTYSFVIRRNGDTDGEVIVDGWGAVSASGRPLLQNFRIYLCTPALCDENRAAGFEGTWVWRAGSVDSVVFATWPEVGSDSMRLVGYPPGSNQPVVLVTVPAHGRPWVYALTVPHGICDRFAVSEIIGDHSGDASNLFSVGEGPPEHLSALLAQNVTLAWPPRTNEPVVTGRAGTEQMFLPAHLIAYSSRNDFLHAFDDVWQALRSDGWVVNTWLGSKSAASCRWAFWQQWSINLNAGWPPPRCVVVGESNQDTLDSRNIVGMETELDETGDCFFSTCANPGWWTDFYDRRRKEAPVYQVPVATLAEAQNVARAWQQYMTNYATAPRTLYLDVGDRDSCVAVPNPRQLLEQTIAPLYREHGYTVTQHNESDFPCGYYGAARDSGRAVFSRRGGLEVVSSGPVTSRTQWAAKTIQKAYSYPWTGVAVPQQNIGWLLSCDMADIDRENTNYPGLAKMWLTVNPDSYATMAAIVGYTRGGYGTHQDTVTSNLFRIRWSGTATEVGEVVWQTEQELWDSHPELVEHFYRLYMLGLPIPLPGGAGLTAISSARVEQGLFTIERCFPNPFRDRATVRFSVAQPSHIALRVFDVKGRIVMTLADHDKLPGYYVAFWDGRDDAGRIVPAGVYFVALSAGKMALTERIVLLR